MDVNGTRFHLLLTAADWTGDAGLPAELDWNPQEEALELASLPFVFPPRHAESPPSPDSRRGAGRDRFGNWYWIDGDAERILARAPGEAAPQPFWPVPALPAEQDAGEFTPADPAPAPATRPLRGLAVTTEHFLLVGMMDPAGLLVFDLAAGGPPVALAWPTDVPFAPWDIAPAPDGGAWVLDVDHRRLWSLDRHFRVRAAALPPVPASQEAEFTPAHPPPEPSESAVTAESVEPARPVTVDAALDVSAVPGLFGVEALCDDSAILLGVDAGAPAPALYRYTLDGAAATFRIAPLLADHANVAAELMFAHDVAFVPDDGCGREEVAGTIFLVAPSGNQAFAFRLEDAAGGLVFVERFYPMRRFGGRALVAVGGEAHYDSGDRWVALLEQPRPRYEAAGEVVLPPTEPGTETGAFDGREPGCVWHRLFLDACIPPGCMVAVDSRAADTLAELASANWREEPAPYLRAGGSELPWRRTAGVDAAGVRTQDGTWELLFQAARGRWLQLRLRLQGNGRTSPQLRALRVYYPRFSYLREYLPAVWRDEPESASFVDRFLANVEGTFTDVEGRMAATQVLFDTRTVPAEFLDWLAGWIGASLDAAWDEQKRRFFVANALRMYAGRGTRQGMIRALRLALEACPAPDLFDTPVSAAAPASARFTVRVVEQFLARSAPGVEYEDAGFAAPAAAAADATWTPALGPGPLHDRWRRWLARAYGDVGTLNDAWGTHYASLVDPSLRLSPTPPTGAAAGDWRRFLRDGLEFTYAAPTSADLPLWRDFLERRYGQPADLRRAWRRHGSQPVSFEAVAFPEDLPAAGAELADWIAFVSAVLPMRRGAHRFTVLVPVQLDDPPSVQRARRALAERLAALEKPAHTVVRTRLYWAAFQVGQARLGTDSVLGLGSRFATLLIGRGELAATHLGWVEPWNVGGRRVVGRDPVAVRSRVTRLSARCS